VLPPCAAQLPYNLALRAHVEGLDAVQALDASGAAVVASFVLHGGVLTGKYADGAGSGRMRDELDDPDSQPFLETARSLTQLAAGLGATAAALAIVFALANPRVASVLFGATSPEQVAENARAVELLEQLEPTTLAELQVMT
jgi:aryl-alcohol dehydrogenase-like predicted oxidoreductase